jgi:NAD(P)-dependent dehydrogenase (short-subunit alcohol dehydrogenase family)
MTERLKDKVAIVVGAGCTPGETIGNGRAAAILFARAGASIILADRDADSAAETKHAIDAEGGESSVVEADVTRADACAHIAEECLRRYGRIDVLHNNVGIGVLGGAVELAEADWDRVLNTNLKAMFLTCKHVLPHMERRGCGAIVNVSSVAAERAAAAYPLLAYSASKGGVNALTRSMAMQYAAKGIRVNAIMPGLIKTPMAVDEPARRYGLDREAFIRMRDGAVPMGTWARHGTWPGRRCFSPRTRRGTSPASCSPWTAGFPARGRCVANRRRTPMVDEAARDCGPAPREVHDAAMAHGIRASVDDCFPWR